MFGSRFKIRRLMIVIAVVAVGLAIAPSIQNSARSFDSARLLTFEFGLLLALTSFAVIPVSYAIAWAYDLIMPAGANLPSERPIQGSRGKRIPGELVVFMIAGVAVGSMIIGLNIRAHWEHYQEWLGNCQSELSRYQLRREVCLHYAKQIAEGRDRELEHHKADCNKGDNQLTELLRAKFKLREQAIRRFWLQAGEEGEKVAQYQQRINHRHWYFIFPP